MKITLYILAAICLILGAALLLPFCSNNPWPEQIASGNTLFLTYSTQIRYLDSSASYYVHESAIMDNIVETPLAYHYLKRPYQLIPLLLTEIPQPQYFDADGQPLDDNAPANNVKFAKYILRLRKDVSYQPHACFNNTTRRLKAEDFHTAIVRICDPRTSSPVYSNLCSFLPGMRQASDTLNQAIKTMDENRRKNGESNTEILKYPSLPDYRTIHIPGIEVIDDDTIVFTLSRKYPQFNYWLAMHFFSPIPWEALAWYNSPERIDDGQDFRNAPVGTGAYMLDVFEPNDHIILTRNPNFHQDFYPSEGMPDDELAGRLADAGKLLPFIDRIYFKYEPEAIPAWIKFQQGYYDINGDNSGLPLDLMDSAVTIDPVTGKMELTPEMAEKQLQMSSSIMLTSYYFAFNWLDPVIGGHGESQRLLRTAITAVLDMGEYIDIFKNGNGIIAENILPPGIFGYLPPPTQINANAHQWNKILQRSECKNLTYAQELMRQAGYPGGIGPDGKPLVIHLDHAAAGNPGFKARFAWIAERLSRIGIILEERQSDLNRLRSKIENGDWQMQFERGWVADYPDAENFFMLFYGENGIIASGGRGCNNFNYKSDKFDSIFCQLETMQNSPERQNLISQAIDIMNHDAPIVFAYFPINTVLSHQWLHNYKPNAISYDKLKYLRLDPDIRVKLQKSWNRPIFSK